MGERRPFELDASDGVKLHGYLTLPQGREPKRLPLVVLPHGGPHGIYDDWRFDEEAQLLASRGYAVLQLNFRGSGGYGRRFIESGYRQWGARMQQDLSEATRAAIERGFADQKRVCIYGASYGGYAALMGAVRDPDLYRCAIGYAGVYDLRMMYQRGDIQQTLFGERYLALAIGSDANELAQRSPVAQVEKIKAAIMLIHGGQDRRVPIAHANAMRKALDGRHYKYEWFTEATEGHGFYREDHRIELYQRMLAFLDAQIGAKAAVAAAE
jgi:dipeptidyl aminopeptidase/acylaminoacyl peptidase